MWSVVVHSVGSPIVGDFSESAREPTVSCNTQPATQVQSLSFKHSQFVPIHVYWHVLMFSLPSVMNERHPQTASTGRIVKAASLIHCLQF